MVPAGGTDLVSTYVRFPHICRGGGGGEYSASSNPTFANLPKSTKFSFGGGVGILPTQTQSPIISDNFHFSRGRGVFCPQNIRVYCGIWTKISTTLASSYITDSLLHTMYVETNDKRKSESETSFYIY